MKFKEALENNPFAALSITAITAASVGWGSHVAFLAQSKQDTVLQGTYVLKEDIESGSAKLYVTRGALEKAAAESNALREKLEQAVANAATDSKARRPTTELDAIAAALKSCQSKTAELQQGVNRPQKQECPSITLDNYYVHPTTGSFNVPACIADGTAAASALGASVARKDNSLRVTGDLGTPEGYFCNIACYESLVNVSCNTLSNQRSIGLTTRLRDAMSLR